MTEQNDARIAAQAMDAGDYEEAVRVLNRLAEQNSEYALLTLGWIYETGAAGVPDKEAASSYYRQAASQGSAIAHHYLGWLLLRSGQEHEARRVFERGAELNSLECKTALARLADNFNERLAAKALQAGAYDEAVRLLHPLAGRNSEYALLTLGWIHESGACGTPDKDAARAYYERAASQGSAAAHFGLGRIFSGEGKQTEARIEFRAGAERGDIACMSELGQMMLEGVGGPSEAAEGWIWLERAAANGHIFAQRALLDIKEQNAQSTSEKLSIKVQIAKLAMKWAKESMKNPYSGTLR